MVDTEEANKERFKKGKIEDWLSLLLAAAEEYDAKYNAIKITLDNAKINRFLPESFEVPDNLKKFKELYSKPKRKGKYQWKT